MIMITGATGFLGTALADDLRARGRSFRAVSRTAGAGHLALGDLNGQTDWTVALAGIDTVVHLAARTHVTRETDSDPLAAYRLINVAATVNLARQAAAAGVRRLVFLSSVKVNGEGTRPGHSFTADDAPRPEDAYGISKLEAETALFALSVETGLQVVVVRPPLIYGPGVKANFASLMRVARRGVPLPFGAVGNKRSLVYSGNLTDLIITCIDHPAAAGEVFLASDGEDLSTGGLVARIARAAGRRSPVFAFPPSLLMAAATLLRRRAMAQRLLESLQVDIAKTRNMLGWSPPFSVDDGLRRTVAAG